MHWFLSALYLEAASKMEMAVLLNYAMLETTFSKMVLGDAHG